MSSPAGAGCIPPRPPRPKSKEGRRESSSCPPDRRSGGSCRLWDSNRRRPQAAHDDDGGVAIIIDQHVEPDHDDHPTIGDFGTAHIVHFDNGDAWYFPADIWAVDLDNGSNPDDDGHVHYVAHEIGSLDVDTVNRTVHHHE